MATRLTDSDMRIIRALENPKIKWRTPEGVAAEAGVSLAEALAAIDRNQRQFVQGPVRSSGGVLFATRRKFIQRSSWVPAGIDVKNS